MDSRWLYIAQNCSRNPVCWCACNKFIATTTLTIILFSTKAWKASTHLFQLTLSCFPFRTIERVCSESILKERQEHAAGKLAEPASTHSVWVQPQTVPQDLLSGLSSTGHQPMAILVWSSWLCHGPVHWWSHPLALEGALPGVLIWPDPDHKQGRNVTLIICEVFLKITVARLKVRSFNSREF